MVYKKLIRQRVNDDFFRKVCQESKSMEEAAAVMNLHFNSFKKRANELGCYKPNKSGRGLNKKTPKISLDELIIKGNFPHYQTYKLKKRLIEEGVKKNVCENCGCLDWLDKPINFELHHLDGNRQNHKLNNLMLLCPNCHSQTDTYRAKNKKI